MKAFYRSFSECLFVFFTSINNKVVNKTDGFSLRGFIDDFVINWCKKYKQTFTKITIKCLQIAINLTKRHAIALRISYQVIASIQRDSEFIAPVILL